MTDTDVPFWDALPTAGSVAGQWLLGRQYVENWPVWVAVNLVSVALFAYKGLWLTVVLYALFTVMALAGGARGPRRANTMSGKVIAIVGAESTGKSTLALALAAAHRRSDRPALRRASAKFLREWCEHAGRTPRRRSNTASPRNRHRRVVAATLETTW